MFNSKIDLSKDVRARMIELLNASLVDAIDLNLQAKQAHWNVKGPHFLMLHEFFDRLYEETGGYVDMLAERATALGGVADGRVGHVAENTRLPAYSKQIKEGLAHLDALATAFAAFGKEVRSAIDAADESGDAITADLFTEIGRGVDKQLWFIEAHLQGGQPAPSAHGGSAAQKTPVGAR